MNEKGNRGGGRKPSAGGRGNQRGSQQKRGDGRDGEYRGRNTGSSRSRQDPSNERSYGDRTFRKENDSEAPKKFRKPSPGRSFNKSRKTGPLKPEKKEDGTARLNKFVANSGKCSRREADDFIKAGIVKVNGKVITEMGYQVQPGDIVHFGDEKIAGAKNVYVILNKPKDYSTSQESSYSKRSVMSLVRNACKESIAPVGRMGRQVTGLLLLTNDMQIAKKLSSANSRFTSMYQVDTDRNMKLTDLEKLKEGVQVDDRMYKAAEVSFVGTSKTTVGVEIASGKHQTVRRMFETLGYKVIKLDRVMYAGLTKKDLPRGRYRHLTEKEVAFLKML